METEKITEEYLKESGALADSTAKKRLSALFDNGEYTELDRFAKSGDAPCEAVTAYGCINGVGAYAFSQDKAAALGAMGAAQGAKLARLYSLAEKNGCPVVGIFDSAGGHIEEGVGALSAYGELLGYASRLSGVVPQISVVAGACTGSAALLADMADLTVVAANAKEDFAGEYAAVADDDIAAVKTAALLLSYLPQNNLAEPLWSQYAAPAGNINDKKETVRALCDAGSGFALYAGQSDCVKVHLARMGGLPCGIVDARPENGIICAAGAAKAARFVRMCDAFSLPVVTLLDAEEISDAKSAAALAHAYAEATAPKVTVITGKAVGNVYIAMAGRAAGADAVYAWDGAAICALKPCTAVQFMYQERLASGEERTALEKEYAKVEGSPFKAAAAGCIDDVILPQNTALYVQKALEAFAGKRVSTLSKKHSNIPL